MATEYEIAVAMMLARGEAQTTIQDVLGLTKGAVIRLKGQAVHQNKLLTYPNPRIVESNAKPKSAWAKAEALVNVNSSDLSNKLRKVRKDSVLRGVHSLPSGTERTPDDRRRQIFGLAAAPIVYDLFVRCNHVGLAYGESLRSVISGMQFLPAVKRPKSERPRSERPRSELTLWPLRGDPIKEGRGVRASSTALAFECQDVLNSLWGNSKSRRARARSLSGVPAIVPSSLSADTQAIKRFAAENSTFREMFTGKERLARKLNCIVTSIGVSGEWGQYSSAYFASWGQSSWIAQNVLGDMCGILIPRPALPGRGSATSGSSPTVTMFEAMQEAWLGIEKGDFLEVSKRDPGVVMVVSGVGGASSREAHRRYVQAKASVVYECCTTLNVVSHLIVDHEIMEQLLA